MKLMRIAALSAALSWCASAATRITLTFKLNDGSTAASGYLYLTGPKGSGANIPTTRKVTLVNGVFDTSLTGCPACSYDVQYFFTDAQGRAVVSPPSERWSVPDLATTITNRNALLGGPAAYNLVSPNDLNISGLLPGQTWLLNAAGTALEPAYPAEPASVPFGSVTGDPQDNSALASALAQKMNAAVGSGALKLVNGVPTLVGGNSTDCVKVDGSSGACGTGTGSTSAAFADITGEPSENASLNTALNQRALATDLTAHANRTDNPHSTTKAQVGLPNVANALQLQAGLNLSDLGNVVTARSNLGLGSAALLNTGTGTGTVALGDHNHSGTYALFAHAHAASEVTSGVFNCARLGTGCAGSGANVLWDDGTWHAPPGASGGEANTTSSGGTGGIGLVLPKSGVDLPFKSLYAGSTKISLTDDSDNKRVAFDIVTANIDHAGLLNVGSNSHAQIDAHLGATNNPHGTTAAQVGLGAVTNTADADKPVSTAQQTALNLKANLASPTLTGTPTAPTAAADTNTTQVASTAYVLGQAGAATPVINGTGAAGTSPRYSRQDHVHPTDTSRAPVASPTFTGTVSGISKSMVGLGNVDNTSDTAKPVSTAQQTALDLKAPLASPTFTGTVSGVTKAMVGLGNVDNTADSAKPVSTATQTALDAKAPLASPTFTGTVSGVSKSMVGLGNVDNTSDANKPVSTATQTALDAKQSTSAKDTNGGYIGRDSSGNASIPGEMVATGFRSSDTTKSSIDGYTGKTSGELAFAVADVAGTATTLIWPTDSSGATTGKALTIGDVVTCPTLPSWAPTTCRALSWSTVASAGGSGLVTSATWSEVEAGTTGNSNILGTMTWAQVEGM